MQLSPQEKDKLMIFTAALVAERRKEKGIKLNYPESFDVRDLPELHVEDHATPDTIEDLPRVFLVRIPQDSAGKLPTGGGDDGPPQRMASVEISIPWCHGRRMEP